LLGDVAGVLDLGLEPVAFLRDLVERIAVLVALGRQGLKLAGHVADLLLKDADRAGVIVMRHRSRGVAPWSLVWLCHGFWVVLASPGVEDFEDAPGESSR